MSWEELFRAHTVAQVREKWAELKVEKDKAKTESSSSLGAAYPEILSLCSRIQSLSSSVSGHESALARLSSVETTNKWRRISENADKYYQQELNAAKSRSCAELRIALLNQINALVADGELLQAARNYYLLSKLGSSPDVMVLDDHLNNWLQEATADNDAILAYILRYKVTPTELSKRLAKHRLIKLESLSVFEAIALMDKTVYSLDYIADYQLKFRETSTKLVDTLEVDPLILPENVVNLPLYPHECYSLDKPFDKQAFVQSANESISHNISKFINGAEAGALVSMYSVLIREGPDLIVQTRKQFTSRLETLIEQVCSSISSIEVPETVQQPKFDLSDPADTVVLRVRGQSGTLEGALERAYQWHQDVHELTEQVQHLEVLRARAPPSIQEDLSSSSSPNLLEVIQNKSRKALNDKLEYISSEPNNVGAAIIIAVALDKDSSCLQELYSKLVDAILADWRLDASTTRLAPFPSKGLLRSLNRLVESMDSVAVGFDWEEQACDIMRERAYTKLEQEYQDDIEFVDVLFGKSDNAEYKPAVDRVRTLLAPLASATA